MTVSQAPAPRPHSYYAATLHKDTNFPSLAGTITVDVAIIGGGFTGISTAVELAERGLKVAVLETHRIGWGASGRNGGQVTGSLSGDTAMRSQLREKLGNEVDDFIWSLRWRGQQIIEERVKRYAIKCDLKRGHIHAAMKPSHLPDLQALYDEAQVRGMGDQVTLLGPTEIREHLASDLYIGGLRNQRNLHIHPLNLCIGEAHAAASLGALIFEQSKVLEIVHGSQPAVITAQGRVNATHVLLAGDVYHQLEQDKLAGTIFPAMGGIVTTEPLGDRAKAINPHDLAVYDCRFVLDYYRLTADGRLLFGGGANYSGRESRDVAAELRPAIESTFPLLKGVKIDYAWTCAMGIMINRVPQLRRLSDHVWSCQGYSGHGVATSHIMGEIMAEALTGHLGRFDVMASCKSVKVPLGKLLGNPLLSAGMWYYNLLEKMR